jgi:hypothetical protein
MTQLNKVGTVATSVFSEDGYTKVVYHQTVVCKWNEQEIILDSGGWQTNTTKTRMNQASNQYALGFQVFQRDFDWFVAFYDEGYFNENAVIEFDDGMIIPRTPYPKQGETVQLEQGKINFATVQRVSGIAAGTNWIIEDEQGEDWIVTPHPDYPETTDDKWLKVVLL